VIVDGVFVVSGGRGWKVVIAEGTSRWFMEGSRQQPVRIVQQPFSNSFQANVMSMRRAGRDFRTRLENSMRVL
jgi:hypothetical protein